MPFSDTRLCPHGFVNNGTLLARLVLTREASREISLKSNISHCLHAPIIALFQTAPMKVGQPKRILFVHRSLTGGHAAAAQAMVDALQEFPGVQAESLNLLSQGSPQDQARQKQAYQLITRHLPRLRRKAFQLAFRGSTVACGLAGLALDWQARRAPQELAAILERKPDLVVATHSVTARMLSYWKKSGQLKCPVQAIATDFRTHRMWKQDSIEHYYVAPGGCKQDLIGFGVSPEKISETGIPIRPHQSRGLPQAELKRHLGLNADLPAVLISGGSLGLQPFSALVDELQQLPHSFQIVCVTAKNAQARQELEQRPPQSHPLIVTGTVSNLGDYLEASDLVLTKPGGLTCSEILAQQKPMVFAELYQGLETPLIARLVETGAAVAGQTVEATAQKVGELLEARRPRPSLVRLSRPKASQEIAKEMLGLKSEDPR